MTTRRLFLAGAASLIAAPAIVRASSIMRVVMPKPTIDWRAAAQLRALLEAEWDRMAENNAKLINDQVVYGVSFKDQSGNRIDPATVQFRPKASFDMNQVFYGDKSVLPAGWWSA